MAIQNLMSLNYLMPGVAMKFDASRAIRGLRGMPLRLLLVGQASADGQGQRNTLLTVSTEPEAIATFGHGSMLLAMWRAAKRNAALDLPIDAVIVEDDDTAEAATGSVAIQVDAAHESGEVPLYIGGRRVRIGVSVADTMATATTKLVNAINNYDPPLPVTAASAAAGTVTLTCNWKGATGNQIDLRNSYFADDRLPQGVTLTITPMVGGSVNPDCSRVITAMQGVRPTEIAWPYTDSANMALIETELTARWAEDNMQDGQAVTVMRGTEGEVTAWLMPRNCHQVHTLAVTRDLTNPWETAAMAAAAIESHVSTDPAVPFTGVTLTGYVAASPANHWEVTQANNLLLAGGSVLEVMPDGTANLLRMVTNYKRHPTGAADPSYRNLNWVKTLSYWRWFVVTEFQVKYRGFKCAEYLVEAIPGQKVMTKELGQEIMLGLYAQFCAVALMQNPEYCKQVLITEIDGTAGRLKVLEEPVIVTQHYQTEITSQFAAGHV